MKSFLLIIGVCVLFSLNVSGQTGTLKGEVIEEETGLAVPAAAIIIRSKKNVLNRTAADLQGKYSFEKIDTGFVSIEVSALGYRTHIINGVKISYDKNTLLKVTLGPDIPVEESEVVYRYFHMSDSLGNSFCIDAFANQTDSLGRKQGVWKDYFRNYSDTKSGYSIGQKVSEGSYKDDKKEGEWIYYKPDGEIKSIKFYKKGIKDRNKKWNRQPNR